MKAFYLKNFRKGLATNSSSTHSVIYQKKGDMLSDLDIFSLDFYDRFNGTIAATKEAKIKYVMANIMHNGPLVKAMSALYPSMKKYLPKVRKAIKAVAKGDYDGEYAFGMYFRGDLYCMENMEMSIDYLTYIIENDDIVIVGGSDEMDFVYDVTEGHEAVPMPNILGRPSQHERGQMIYRNGNYWVGFGHEKARNCSMGRIRFALSDAPLVPYYPELIDLRITNRCNHGCKFCFMDSNMNEQDADIAFLKRVIRSVNNATVEFSVGGGNILLYPHLEELFSFMRDHGHIINVTISHKDCETIVKSPELVKLFSGFVDGIGISVTDETQIDQAVVLQEALNGVSHYALHLIPEYLGVDKTEAILNANRQGNRWFDILYLGYKTNGRGATQKYHTFTDGELIRIMVDHFVSIDTTFANRYRTWLEQNYNTATTITYNEGEYSMYIDGVTKNAYKSSYQLDKPYNMDYGSKDENVEHSVFNAIQAFHGIREDGGFPTKCDISETLNLYYKK